MGGAVTAIRSAETSTVFPITMAESFECTDGTIVDAVTVWIHRPGDHWAYRVWRGDGVMVLRRTRASLEDWFPGLFDAIIVPAFATDLRNVGQLW